MIYFIILLFLFILSYKYDYQGAIHRRLTWWIITMIVFIIVAGMRYRLGTDSIRYERGFINGPDLSTLTLDTFRNSRFSPLYIILNAAVRSMTDQFIVFQFVHAIIVNGVIFYFFYKNCRKIFFSAIFYFIFLYFTLNMEVLREALAVCVFLVAWPYFRDGKWLLWYLLCFVGFLCHTSAIFMFILPVITVPGINKLFVLGKRTIIVCIVIYVAFIFIRMRFFHIIQSLAIIESVAERAETYSNDDLASSTLSIVGVAVSTLKSVIYPLCALFLLNNENNKLFPKDSRFVAMTLMSVYVGIVTMLITIFYRFNNYFLFFPIVAFADLVYSNLIINRRKIKLSYIAWIVLFIPLLFAQVRLIYFGNVNKSGTLKSYMNYYPYASRLEQSKDKNREKVFTYNHAH